MRRVSRHGIDHTHRYPVMAAAVAQLTPRTTVLDGETGGVRQATPLTLCLAAPPSARRAGHTARAHRVRRPLRDGPRCQPGPLRDRRLRLEDVDAGADLVHACRRLAPNGLEPRRPCLPMPERPPGPATRDCSLRQATRQPVAAGSDEEEDCTGRCSPPAAYRQAARPPSPALPPESPTRCAGRADEQSLREKVREKLRSGVLPKEPELRLWAGPGAGTIRSTRRSSPSAQH